MAKNAIILLSGGLDSATVLAIALSQGYTPYCLSVNYQQRHKVELQSANRLVQAMGIKHHKVIDLDLTQFGGSALTDSAIDVPQYPTSGIPITYVPARNTVMLSLALAWAEVVQANAIFIGVNIIDYSGYPDCREPFLSAFENMANIATKSGIEGNEIKIHAPLMHKNKAEIIQIGNKLGVDYALTVSCYSADEEGKACGKCDACHYRRLGFQQANVPDPTKYQNIR